MARPKLRDPSVKAKDYRRNVELCESAGVVWKGWMENIVRGTQQFLRFAEETGLQHEVERYDGLSFDDVVGCLRTTDVWESNMVVMKDGSAYYVSSNGEVPKGESEKGTLKPRRADVSRKAVKRKADVKRRATFARVVSLNDVQSLISRMADLERLMSGLQKTMTGHIEMHKAGAKKLEELENAPVLTEAQVAKIEPAVRFLNDWEECEGLSCSDCTVVQQRQCFDYYVRRASRAQKLLRKLPLSKEALAEERHQGLMDVAKNLGVYKFGNRKAEIAAAIEKKFKRIVGARRAARTRKRKKQEKG